MSQIVSQQQVKDSALTDLVRTDTRSVQSLKQMFSDVLVNIFLLMESGISVIEDSSVIVE